MDKATTRPWRIVDNLSYPRILGADDSIIAPSNANAALIVRCVNQHDALEQALTRLLKEAEMLSAVEGSRWASQELGDAFRQARAALDAEKEE